MNNLLIIKLGGSAITDKSIARKVRENVLERIAKELSQVVKMKKHKLILVHGGGSFGHPLAYKYGLTDGIRDKSTLIGVSETLDAMRELSLIISNKLREFGVPVFPIQSSSVTILDSNNLSVFFTKTIELALRNGLIPLMWGDVSLDVSKGCGILSGDVIIFKLAQLFKPEKVIFGTDVDGVFLDYPVNTKLISKISKHNLYSIMRFIRPVDYMDVTGGFYKKMEIITGIARLGIKVQIINLLKSGNLIGAILGNEDIGTIVSL